MDWSQITLIVLVVLLLLCGGFIKRLTKEIKDLVDCFSIAIEDKNITSEELSTIIKEAKDVSSIIVEIIQLVALKRG